MHINMWGWSLLEWIMHYHCHANMCYLRCWYIQVWDRRRAMHCMHEFMLCWVLSERQLHIYHHARVCCVHQQLRCWNLFEWQLQWVVKPVMRWMPWRYIHANIWWTNIMLHLHINLWCWNIFEWQLYLHHHANMRSMCCWHIQVGHWCRWLHCMHDNMFRWLLFEWKLHLHHHANMCRLPCRHIHGHIWQSDVVHRLHRLPLVLLCGCSMHVYLQHWVCILL